MCVRIESRIILIAFLFLLPLWSRDLAFGRPSTFAARSQPDSPFISEQKFACRVYCLRNCLALQWTPEIGPPGKLYLTRFNPRATHGSNPQATFTILQGSGRLGGRQAGQDHRRAGQAVPGPPGPDQSVEEATPRWPGDSLSEWISGPTARSREDPGRTLRATRAAPDGAGLGGKKIGLMKSKPREH